MLGVDVDLFMLCCVWMLHVLCQRREGCWIISLFAEFLSSRVTLHLARGGREAVFCARGGVDSLFFFTLPLLTLCFCLEPFRSRLGNSCMHFGQCFFSPCWEGRPPCPTSLLPTRQPSNTAFQGIEPEDAVYLPAVETALSLVHDVHPRVGESVAVFGQGMIG